MLCFLVKNLEQQKIPLNLEFFYQELNSRKWNDSKAYFPFRFLRFLKNQTEVFETGCTDAV